jgi:hypothetical protein
MTKAIIPKDMDEINRLATGLAKSSVIPRSLQGKPVDIATVILKGLELNLTPMQALAEIALIQGKPVMSAACIAGLCARSPVCEYIRLVESDNEKALYRAKRAGVPEVTLAYTVDDARVAGLLTKDNWKKHRKAMLRARAKAAICREVFPELAMGIYDPDEAQEFARTPEEIARAKGERMAQEIITLGQWKPTAGDDPSESKCLPEAEGVDDE